MFGMDTHMSFETMARKGGMRVVFYAVRTLVLGALTIAAIAGFGTVAPLCVTHSVVLQHSSFLSLSFAAPRGISYLGDGIAASGQCKKLVERK